MTKILNLDELEAPVDKILTLKGKDNFYHPFTVQEFIDQMKKAETKDAESGVKTSETVEYMVEMIMRAFPTVDEADLRGLPLDRMKLITDFVNDVVAEDATPEPETGSKKAKGKSK